MSPDESAFSSFPPAAVFGCGMPIPPDVNVLFAAMNSAAGVTLRFSGLLIDGSGQAKTFQQDLTPTSDRVPTTLVVPLSVGWVPIIDVRAIAGAPRRGQCFVRVSLIKGTTANAPSVGTLLQGYAQDTTVLSYPGSPIIASTDGPGVIRSVTGTDPAFGVEASVTVPTNARWRVLAFRATLVASATVANRAPVLVIDDGATVLFETASAIAVTNGQTAQYIALPGAQFFTIGTRSYHLPLPAGLVLQGGSRIRTSTAALEVDDNWGAPQVLVEEWIED